MDRKRISINFCGGCNPRIDRGLIAKEVATLLAAEGYLISFNQPTADLLLYLSGCAANCAEPAEHGDVVFVTVAGNAVGRIGISEDELVAAIVKEVKSIE